jgi:hypothetical protein
MGPHGSIPACPSPADKALRAHVSAAPAVGASVSAMPAPAGRTMLLGDAARQLPPAPGELLSSPLTPLNRGRAEALAIDLSRRSTPTEGGFCTFQPVVDGGACPLARATSSGPTRRFQQAPKCEARSEATFTGGAARDRPGGPSRTVFKPSSLAAIFTDWGRFETPRL